MTNDERYKNIRYGVRGAILPPNVEGNVLIECLENQFNAITGQSMQIALTLKQSAAQRKNILKAAFSGQLVPQDSNDEPAIVLLERIQAERSVQAASKMPLGRKRKQLA